MFDNKRIKQLCYYPLAFMLAYYVLSNGMYSDSIVGQFVFSAYENQVFHLNNLSFDFPSFLYNPYVYIALIGYQYGTLSMVFGLKVRSVKNLVLLIVLFVTKVAIMFMLPVFLVAILYGLNLIVVSIKILKGNRKSKLPLNTVEYKANNKIPKVQTKGERKREIENRIEELHAEYKVLKAEENEMNKDLQNY